MKITRIDTYTDKRFSKDVLYQHGAFLINDKYPCEFYITGLDTATINYHDYTYVDSLIEEFRFYAWHITKFYTKHHKLIRRYPDVKLSRNKIIDLQPSQFYVDVDKIESIMRWAISDDKFVVPVMKYDDELISVDGHTRLYYACILGLKEVYTYEIKTNDNILDFVAEAKKRNIRNVTDMEAVTHEEYIDKWYKYCDDYFSKVEENRTNEEIKNQSQSQ